MQPKALPVAQTAGLTKVFKDFWRRNSVVAVKDLDIEIRRGEVFGLLGPNGSGKSTTIKMLLGLLYPTRGRISIFGVPPTDVAVKARIGFLPEESYLYRFLNARETLDLYGRLFKLHSRQRRDRIDKLLDMVGLTAEAKRRIGEYSKGMARRIGLAQALINDPEFLILDEPTAGLDPIGTHQIKDLIRELAKKGKTILLSSHLLADVEDVCDRVTILYGGRQRAAGNMKELLVDEDRTQLVTEKLAPATIDEIAKLLERLENKNILSVGSPTNRLESFFMKIVQEAQTANVATSGARAAGKRPDFRGAAKPDSLIESLVSAADLQPSTTRAEPVAAKPERPQEPDREIIEHLTDAGEKPDQPAADQVVPTEPVQAAKHETPAADRSVIDALIDRQEGNDRG